MRQTSRRPGGWKRRWAWAVGAVTGVVVLTACATGGGPKAASTDGGRSGPEAGAAAAFSAEGLMPPPGVEPARVEAMSEADRGALDRKSVV